jgi:predicted ATPase/DNA-binding SARP family transcriptional activator
MPEGGEASLRVARCRLTLPLEDDGQCSHPAARRFFRLGGGLRGAGLRLEFAEGTQRGEAAGALARGHAVHREVLCETLWPDRDLAGAQNNLHQVLYVARRALEAAGADGQEALVLRDELVMLCPEGSVWVDVERFEATARAARAARELVAYRRALELYGGDLLPEDRYESSAEPRRASLAELRLALLVELAELEGRAGDLAGAVESLRRAVSAEPLYEPANRALMRALADGGRRQEALAHFERLRSALREAVGADPDPQTRRLYRDLLMGSVAAEPREPEAPVAPARRHNLPHEATSFVGREGELREVGLLLARARLLTVCGAGGSGKSRLAREVAALRVAAFEHGVWLVQLAPLADPELVASEVASTLGLALPDRGSAQAALVEQLSGRRALVVLDNCEHLIDACAALAAAIISACPGVRLLATSREPLRIEGEVAWRVPPLALPDLERLPAPAELARLGSVRLFAERAAVAAPGFQVVASNARAVAELCVRLDGMPLALELGAARVAMLSPEQILERLRDTLGVLGPGSRAALTRQRTLTATLDWSHELLDPDERVLFRRLAVFAGSFGFEAAEQICGREPLAPGAVLELLGRLVEKSLVSVERDGGPVRYRLLETVRQYARERLHETGERELLESAHRTWYTGFAARHDPERAPDLMEDSPRLLDPEHDNLREVLRSSLARDPETSLRLAASVWRYWLVRGYYSEGRRWLDAALALAPAASEVRARALMGVAVLDMRRGESAGQLLRISLRSLKAIADEMVTIHEELGDELSLAQARHLAGMICWIDGHSEEADRLIRDALALAERLGAHHVIAAAEHTGGIIALGRGESAAARRRFEVSGRELAALSDVHHAFFPALTLGFPLERDERGRPRVTWQETMVSGQRLGAAHAAAFLPASIAWAARAEGDLDAAVALARESAQRSATLGWKQGEALAFGLLGNLYRARGEHDEARSRLDSSLSLRRELGDRRAVGFALGCLGLLAAAEGDLAGARGSLRAALELFDRTEDGPGTIAMHLNLGVIALGAGDHAGARGLLEQSRDLLGQRRIPRLRGWIEAHLAEIAREESDGRTAAAHLSAAREIFEELGERDGLLHCSQALAASR